MKGCPIEFGCPRKVRLQIRDGTINDDGGCAVGFNLQIMAGEIAGRHTDGAVQLHVRQRGTGDDNRNPFGRPEILLTINMQAVAGDARRDEREQVLIGGNGQRGFAAGPLNLVGARGLQRGKISNRAVRSCDYSVAFDSEPGTSSGYDDARNQEDCASVHD